MSASIVSIAASLSERFRRDRRPAATRRHRLAPMLDA